MTAWFYIEHLPDAGATIELDEREARHATGARRLDVGESLILFDGRGRVASAKLQTVERGKRVTVHVDAVETVVPPVRRIHVGSALPKGDRLATLLGMATQLGMSSFTALRCRHSVAQWSSNAASRAGRVCLEACKQSHQAYCPVIHDEQTPAAFVAQACDAGHLVLLAQPGGTSIGAVRASGLPVDISILVGPEGGFSSEEVDALSPLTTRVDLGKGILRIETAVVAIMAMMAPG